jgi:serine/threonine protein kinase
MVEFEPKQTVKLTLHCACCGGSECVCPQNTSGAGNPASRADNGPNLRVGQYIGGMYKVIALIGEGGMGIVYKVYHEGLNKYYAAKIFKARTNR